MIAGLGIDLVDVALFRQQLADPASTFVSGTFTDAERAEVGRRGDPALRLAARFAAKEAFIKAWSSANRGQAPALARVDMREIEVRCDEWGRPAIRLHGAVRDALAVRGRWRSQVSLTHDGGAAAAVVVLEALG